jgi:hypothetical protein
MVYAYWVAKPLQASKITAESVKNPEEQTLCHSQWYQRVDGGLLQRYGSLVRHSALTQ